MSNIRIGFLKGNRLLLKPFKKSPHPTDLLFPSVLLWTILQNRTLYNGTNTALYFSFHLFGVNIIQIDIVFIFYKHY